MEKLLTLTITNYDTDQFEQSNDILANYHSYQKVAYHHYGSIYIIEVVDNNMGYLCSIWDSLKDLGVDLAIRNFER